MLDKVIAYIRKWQMLKSGDKVIVGISGGADSVCLLLILHKISEMMDLEIRAVHVHHGLRGEAADRDEAYCVQLCRSLAIPCAVYHKDIRALAKQRRQSEEETGRDVRREVFDRELAEYGGTKMALAHHRNDNAETMIMNLARGTGLKGLGGMQPVNGIIIRPLLGVPRGEIEEYLEGQQISYCEDLTNLSDQYTRNRIRNHVIPCLEQINPQAVGHISAAMERLRLVQEYIDQQTNIWYESCIRFENRGIILLAAEFEKVPEVLKPLVLKRIITELAGIGKDIAAKHLEAVTGLLLLQTGRNISLPYEIIVVRCYEGLKFGKKPDAVKLIEPVMLPINAEVEIDGKIIRTRTKTSAKETLNLGEKHYTKQFDYDIIKNSICIRTRKVGDYIVIDDQGNRQKLKAYFINNKVPRDERDRILLIADGSHIMWITGMRQSKAYQADAKTKKILEIEIEQISEDKDGRDA